LWSPSFWLIILGEEYKLWSSSLCSSSILLSLHLSSVQIFSSAPSVCVPLLMPETKFHTNTEPQANYSLAILIFMFLDSRR
jgi:hypothetical protein